MGKKDTLSKNRDYQPKMNSWVLKGQIASSVLIVLMFTYNALTGDVLDINVAQAIIVLLKFLYDHFAAANNPNSRGRY